MGLRFSKSAVNQCNATQQTPQLQERRIHEEEPYEEHRRESSVLAPINITADASDINYHLPVTPTPTFSNQSHLQRTPHQLHEVGINATSAEELVEATTTSPNLSSSCPGRQIIIKIQLAKMENDQPAKENNNNNNSCRKPRSLTMPSSNSSNNNMDDSSQFLNVAFNQSDTEARQSDYIPKKGAQHFLVNNNFSSSLVLAPAAPTSDASSSSDNSINLLMGPISELQLSESHPSVLSEAASIDSTSTKQTADEPTYEVPQNNCAEAGGDTVEVDSEFCCRRKAKSNTFPSKWRCCRCTCRDAFKRIMDASSSATSSASASSSSASSKVSKKKERKEARSLMKYPQKSVLKKQQQPQHSSQQPALWAAVQPNAHQLQMQGNNSAAGGTSNENAAAHMSIWSPSKNDVIIPITSPQFVVVQCPPSSLVTLGRMDDNSIRLMATELVSSTASSSASGSNSHTPPRTQATPNADCGSISNGSAMVPGPVVHSQVDYIHCLVPDLERITKASFYWGKMDRYEAERLLEGKPEGTFLLRDSAQEEYLFSVTFRKYGRSLHARIEQSNHKFSFDCHDPCVFTASTVTGLLEHYKDPACVMFFEPMLTIPLHRNTTFTLQQLCRATIVSNTSYDGINELELPTRLKCYLKEYHYKQKLRVKPFDEPFYSCT